MFLDNIGYEVFKTDQSYGQYDFHKPMVNLRNFLWETFASHYIELVKARAYNEQKNFKKEEHESAIYTLYEILGKLIMLLSPIIPQVTSVIADELKISLDKFPEGLENPNDALWIVNAIKDFNRDVWKTKKDLKIPLRNPITKISIPNNLRRFEKDLKAAHNLK